MLRVLSHSPSEDSWEVMQTMDAEIVVICY